MVTVFPESLAIAEATALTIGQPKMLTLFKGVSARYKLGYKMPVALKLTLFSDTDISADLAKLYRLG